MKFNASSLVQLMRTYRTMLKHDSYNPDFEIIKKVLRKQSKLYGYKKLQFPEFFAGFGVSI